MPIQCIVMPTIKFLNWYSPFQQSLVHTIIDNGVIKVIPPLILKSQLKYPWNSTPQKFLYHTSKCCMTFYSMCLNNTFLLDCWFWTVPKSSKWRPLHITWREDSSQVDSSRGPSLSQVLHCQWCLELWLPPLWDMVNGIQTIPWLHQCPGKFYDRRPLPSHTHFHWRPFPNYLPSRNLLFCGY